MVAHIVSASSTGGAPVRVPTPPPKLSWCAVMAPSELRYTGTSVQAVYAALDKAFCRDGGQEWPLKLDARHLSVLAGMKAVALDGSEPYDILYAALERFGEIEIRNQ